MYEWRNLSDKDRKAILSCRKFYDLPWHRPPRFSVAGIFRFFITATCYEHKPVIGKSLERMSECEESVLFICRKKSSHLFAWSILPNHYHLLLQTERIKELLFELGRFHGRSSRKWNLEDDQVGRKVWFNYLERPIISEKCFWSSLNYIHHNPVHHGFVDKWFDWSFSSAKEYLKEVGKEQATEIWKSYPVETIPEDWD